MVKCVLFGALIAALAVRIPRGAHAAVPTTAPATSQPAQLPWNSLQNEMFRSVELVQDAIRSPKAQAAKRTPTSMQYKTSLQKQAAAAAATTQPARYGDEDWGDLLAPRAPRRRRARIAVA